MLSLCSTRNKDEKTSIFPPVTESTMPFNVLSVDYNDYIFVYGCWGGSSDGMPDFSFRGALEVAWFLSRTRKPSENATLEIKRIRDKIQLFAAPFMKKVIQIFLDGNRM